MIEIPYKFFMACIPHSDISNVTHTLERYLDPSAGYIIGLETCNKHSETNGEHMHFAVQMTDKEYDAFRHQCFTTTYKLRGRAVEGKPRQYGMVRNVRDETRFLSYTVKDRNIIYKGIGLKTIQQYIESSYERKSRWDTAEALMEYLRPRIFTSMDTLNDMPRLDIVEIEMTILEYFLKNGKVTQGRILTKASLKSYTLMYLQTVMLNREKYIQDIYAYLQRY